MKVKLKHSVQSFSGELDDLVYWTVKRTGLCFARIKVDPELVENHHHFGQINKHLAEFYHEISPDYKRDLQAYTAFYKTEFVGMGDRNPTVFGFFKKMMFALVKMIPTIDLTTITVADVVQNQYPIITISDAINNELLPLVETYGDLDRTM